MPYARVSRKIKASSSVLDSIHLQGLLCPHRFMTPEDAASHFITLRFFLATKI